MEHLENARDRFPAWPRDSLATERCEAPAVPGTYDERALRVAQAVHRQLQPPLVILFGSRARGDYQPESDIDLLIVTDEGMSDDEYVQACRTGHRAIRDLYAEAKSLDVLNIPRHHYVRCRDGQNHVAGQATRDGVTMEGFRMRHEPRPDGVDQEAARQQIRNCDRNLQTLARMCATSGAVPEHIGFHAQQALETILKAWIAALGVPYRKSHDLDELSQIIRQRDPQKAAMIDLDQWAWLTPFAVRFRYEETHVDFDRQTLYTDVTHTVDAVKGRIRELAGWQELPRWSSRAQPSPPDARARAEMRQTLADAHRYLQYMVTVVNTEAEPEYTAHMMAHLANDILQNSLRAWLLALGETCNPEYGLEHLSLLLQTFPTERDTEAMQAWHRLMPRAGTREHMATGDPQILYRAVRHLVDAIGHRIWDLAGMDER